MLLALVVIAVVAAAALACVYALTKKPIEDQQKQVVNNAIKNVLPGFNGKTERLAVVARDGDKDSVIVYLAKDANGELFGAAVETYTKKAFSGSFKIMVGFDSVGNVIGTDVIESSETPGLGDKIKTPEFSGQFAGNKGHKINPRASEYGVKVKVT